MHWIAENCSALQFVSSLPGLQGLGWANHVVGFVAVVIMLLIDILLEEVFYSCLL